MATNNVFQVANNAVPASQSGGGFVLKQTAQFQGGNVLIGFSGSAWSANKDTPISLQLWLDGEPLPAGLLGMRASSNSMHLSLGHVWAYVPKVSPGAHTLAVMAGDATITDQNDHICITVWELGDNISVHFNESVPCPTGTGIGLLKTAFQTRGQTPVMISGSVSGYAASGTPLIGANMIVDGNVDTGGNLEVQINIPTMRLAAVPTDVVVTPQNRGQHGLVVESENATSTDANDTLHVTVVEWVDPMSGPTIVGMNPTLQNAAALSQHGDGGSIAQSTFRSSGGVLLIRTNVSVWTQTANVPLTVGIQIDGTSKGFLQLFANWTTTHMTMVSNDLVLTGIPAGQHTLNLMGEANTITDQNDRVSVTIMEF